MRRDSGDDLKLPTPKLRKGRLHLWLARQSQDLRFPQNT
jgi:hypothetical protein